MNREILFRGKRIDNGEWVYGYFFTKVQFPKLATEREYYYIKPFGGDSNSWSHFEIDPATVGQYTNLIDKNGKKIFEGDVMEFDAYGLHYKGKVFFDEGAFCVTCNHPTASTFLIIALYHDAICVGNIHDNPELMEGELND